jgi:hypothetical protein
LIFITKQPADLKGQFEWRAAVEAFGLNQPRERLLHNRTSSRQIASDMLDASRHFDSTTRSFGGIRMVELFNRPDRSSSNLPMSGNSEAGMSQASAGGGTPPEFKLISGGQGLTVPFFPVADETRIAFKQGGGTGKGGLVPTEVLAPPKTGPVEGYNNIVQFRGAKTPVAPPPGVTAAPGQTFFQQGAFVFAAPTGDDTIAGRKYLGFAPGFSALSLLRASMQAQGFPSGSKVIWGEGLPREHQITADQARRLLATEGSAEDSRGGRVLQRAEQALSGKLLGIMNELAQRQKPATPALATRTPAVAPKPAPVPANEARQTPLAEASSLPPRVRPSTSPLPPPTFEQPVPRPTAPPRDIVAEEAKKQAVLDTRFAEAAVKQAPSWGARADALAGLGRDLSNRATGPQANAANEAFAQAASLVDRGGRLASAVAAADAGKRPDVFVSGRNLPLADARAELGRLTQDADRSLAALKPEIDRLPKASTATSANPFDAPQRPGPGVTLGSPLDKLSPGVRDIVEHELEQIEKDRKLGIGNPVETAIERLKRDGQYAAAIALGQLFPDLVQASSITPRPSSPTASRSDATGGAEQAKAKATQDLTPAARSPP